MTWSFHILHTLGSNPISPQMMRMMEDDRTVASHSELAGYASFGSPPLLFIIIIINSGFRHLALPVILPVTHECQQHLDEKTWRRIAPLSVYS